MTFGESLKAELRRNGISPKELSRLCGVSEPTMEKYMNNLMYPSVPLFALMAESLGTTMDRLFGKGNVKK